MSAETAKPDSKKRLAVQFEWPLKIERSSYSKDRIVWALSDRKHDLNLDYFFKDGGTLGDADVEDLYFHSSNRQPRFLTGSFSIVFTESYYNGCKDLEWKNVFSGTGTFQLNRHTGKMTGEIHATLIRVSDD